MPSNQETTQKEPAIQQNISMLQDDEAAVIGSALAAGVLENTTDGEFNGISWHREDRLGKQQHVAITGFTFPDGTQLPAVIRPTSRDFKSHYGTYPSVRQFYPKIYVSTRFKGEDWTEESDVLVMEKVEGYHGDSRDPNIEAHFQQIVRSPEGLEQLCQEMFEAIEAIHAEPIALTDISPPVGHNVIYNTDTDHFQFFDVDTIIASNATPVEKFLRLIDTNLYKTNNTPEGLAYASRMLQLFLQAHPEEELAFQSELRELPVYDTANEDAADILHLEPNDPEYDEVFFALARQVGTVAAGKVFDFVNPSTVSRSIKTGRDVTKVDPELIRAMLNNDIEKMADLLAKPDRNFRLLVSEFVEETNVSIH